MSPITLCSPNGLAALIEQYGGIQLDIGSGPNAQPGWVGMDIRPLPGVLIVHDFEQFPWPLPDACVIRAVASHVVEHVHPARFGFVHWMNEAWRVMKPNGQLAIVTPHGRSDGYLQDPTHCNPCNEATWAYFDSKHPSQLWTIYRPRPWKIESLSWSPAGNIEVLLRKRDVE